MPFRSWYPSNDDDDDDDDDDHDDHDDDEIGFSGFPFLTLGFRFLAK